MKIDDVKKDMTQSIDSTLITVLVYSIYYSLIATLVFLYSVCMYMVCVSMYNTAVNGNNSILKMTTHIGLVVCIVTLSIIISRLLFGAAGIVIKGLDWYKTYIVYTLIWFFVGMLVIAYSVLYWITTSAIIPGLFVTTIIIVIIITLLCTI